MPALGRNVGVTSGRAQVRKGEKGLRQPTGRIRIHNKTRGPQGPCVVQTPSPQLYVFSTAIGRTSRLSLIDFLRTCEVLTLRFRMAADSN
jgi:hypothetical protein